MVTDDRRSHPMHILLIVELEGGADVDRLSAAYRTAVDWHPMLQSSLEGDRWRVRREAAPELEVVIGGSPAGDGESGEWEAEIDLRRGPTLASRAVITPEKTTLRVWVHHAVTDGVGILEFLGDWLANYAASLGARVRLRPPRIEQLLAREQLDRTIPHPVSRGIVLKTLAKETMRFFTRRAEAIASRPRPSSGRGRWVVVDRTLCRQQSELIQTASAATEAQLNDWILTALMRGVARFNDSLADGRRGKPDGWIIANMPVLMRPRSARHVPAANMIGYGFLARRRDQLHDWDAAVASIAYDSQEIQRWKMAGLFNDAVAITRRIPGALWLTTRSWIRPASFVCTHVGDPSRRFRSRFPVDDDGYPMVGDLVLKRVYGTAPTRPGTNVAALVSVLAGRLTFCLRGTASELSAEDAEKLLAHWIEEALADR